MRGATRQAASAAFLSYAFGAMLVDVSTHGPCATPSLSRWLLASATKGQIQVRFQVKKSTNLYTTRLSFLLPKKKKKELY